MKTKQMAVALYFIDKLALRAGHEKDEDEADTVGCCTLKVSLLPCFLPVFTLFPLPCCISRSAPYGPPAPYVTHVVNVLLSLSLIFP